MDLIEQALKLLEERMKYKTDVLSSPSDVRNYLRLRLAELEHEEFYVVWLDCQNCVIDCALMFRGTLTQTSVYPREVVKEGLRMNAAACILAHNHPSGCAEPSRADELITKQLKETLGLIDIKVLDHFVIGGTEIVSFAERGMI